MTEPAITSDVKYVKVGQHLGSACSIGFGAHAA